MTRHKLAVATCIAVGLLSSRARAQRVAGDSDRAGGSIAGEIGFLVGNYGYAEFATGFRGGYTFPFHLYLGGALGVYFGDSTIFTIGPEVGYDIGVRHNFDIRPYGGLSFIDITPGGTTAAEFYPGCLFLFFPTHGLFLGGDVRTPLLFVPRQTVISLNLMFTIGYKW